MAKISDRVDGYVEKKRKDWGKPLGDFVGGIFEGIGDRYVQRHEPDILDTLHDAIDKISKSPDVPPEFRKIADRLNGKRSGWMIIAGLILLPFILIPMITSVMQPIGRLLNYAQDRLLHSYRRDPMTVINAWRRDPTKYARLFDDLKDQGFSEDAIETLKYVTQYIPGVSDVIRFGVREVYTPAIRTKFGLDEDFPDEIMPDADRIGLAKEELLKYWGAHWELPSTQLGYELLHRGEINEEELKILLRTLDVMPYWRDKLAKIAWDLPNRIEIRMMARYLDLSKPEVMELLKKAGLAEEYRSDAADFMIIMGLTGYWADMLRNNWMSASEVKADIDGRGLKPVTAERIYRSLVKYSTGVVTAKEKDLTKAEIVKGVKVGVISRTQGGELLVDMGYSVDEAIYILAIDIPEDELDVAKEYRQLTKSEILSGLRTAVIDRGQARDRLLELRYSASDAEYILKMYDAQVKPPEEPKEKEASKADIVLGVKKGLITQEEGYLMLIELGFSAEASNFILMVKTAESPFSPKSFEEFKDITQKYRQATGREVKAMPEELKAAAEEVVRLTKDVEALKDAVKLEKEKLLPGEELPAAATARLKELQVKLHRAEPELARVKSNYDRLVAEWRHSA